MVIHDGSANAAPYPFQILVDYILAYELLASNLNPLKCYTLEG